MKRLSAILIASIVLLGTSTSLHAGLFADIEPGVRGGWYVDEEDFFLAVDTKIHLLRANVNPNIEWVFASNADLFTFNLDGFWNFSPMIVASIWGGAGVGLHYFSPDRGSSATDVAFNLIAGVEANIPLSPYLMVKYVFVDRFDGFVIGAGVRF